MTEDWRWCTHRMTKHPIYRIWADMKSRCNNPKDTSWSNYGGRGIRVCDRWHKFEEFYKDMGPTYEEGLTIERNDNGGNYCKENCCWITKNQQKRNTRANRRIATPWGKIALVEAAERAGLSYKTVSGRVYRKWPEKHLLEPPGFRMPYGDGINRR